jgi:hypothetical protein
MDCFRSEELKDEGEGSPPSSSLQTPAIADQNSSVLFARRSTKEPGRLRPRIIESPRRVLSGRDR